MTNIYKQLDLYKKNGRMRKESKVRKLLQLVIRLHFVYNTSDISIQA